MQRDRQREGIEGSGGECAYVIQGGAGGIFNGEEGERNFLGRGQRVRRGGKSVQAAEFQGGVRTSVSTPKEVSISKGIKGKLD